MATSYTKAQLTMYLTQTNAEIKAMHEKLARLQLENATLRSQLKAAQSEVTKHEVTKHEAPKLVAPEFR